MHVHFRPPKFNWRAYCTRKVAVLSTLVVLTYLVENFMGHPHYINKAHELTLAALCEHVFFGIPFDDTSL